jgi:hypothetical protein
MHLLVRGNQPRRLACQHAIRATELGVRLAGNAHALCGAGVEHVRHWHEAHGALPLALRMSEEQCSGAAAARIVDERGAVLWRGGRADCG